ncbi:MAG: signal recognition particle-docking protein FtsY [Candidatus Hydrogenedentota bacterium]|nr:MAG: signal recognition particle-docking protein FtsY [Candidatus Hydrogenedentota bacterium]
MLTLAGRLRRGLEKTRKKMSAVIDVAVGRGLFDDAAAEQIEEALIEADIGPEIALRLVEDVREWVRSAGGGVTAETVREKIEMDIAEILRGSGSGRSEEIPPNGNHSSEQPRVTILVGVNGSGKTTTAAKLAAQAAARGSRVLLGAADTFRAAAIDQLRVWAERIGCEFVAQDQGADPAAVAFDAVQAGKSRGCDEVFIDTAGRLHTQTNLMAELEKVIRVLGKIKPPDHCFLTLDATTGRNGLQQITTFSRSLPVDGLIVTKLDGSARAGVVVEAVERLKIPVRYVGVGETVEDLMPFDPEAFARELVRTE